MLAVNRLAKTFIDDSGNEKKVLNEVSFEVKDHEFVCVLGKSGCGKSTLLSILAGFSTSEYGRCRLDGKEINGPSKERGVVFQEYALYPWYTVLENVAFGPTVNKVPNAKEIAMKFIRMVGMEEYAGYYPDSLSGGMKQRVSIARALANNPKMLLMDEPFSALDPFTREKMREELLKIWGENKTMIVFITHSVPEAVYLADRVIMIKEGNIALNKVIDIPRKRDMNDPKFVEYVNEFEALLADGQMNQEAKKIITND